MQTKAEVQQRVAEFLKAKRWSMRQLALAMGLSPSTLARMMEDNPTYRGEPDAWTQLASYRDLGLDPAEVLAAVGLGPPRPIILEPVPPLQQIERALHAGPWKPEVRAAIFTLLRETAQV